MQIDNQESGFLRSKAARVLTAVLILQAMLFYGLSRGENVPTSRPLSQFPHDFGGWRMAQEGVIEKEVQDVLKADELLSRSYVDPADAAARVPAHLFVAYFRSQRTGQAPHSPKNCLPGSGWVQSESDQIEIPIAGRPAIEVNRYLVAKGDNKSVVLYWYQSRDRVVASEYRAKFFVVADAIRYNRTDTALVRIVVPVIGNNESAATELAVKFVKDSFAPLRQHFPA